MRRGWMLIAVSVALASWPIGYAPQDTHVTDLLVLAVVLAALLLLQVGALRLAERRLSTQATGAAEALLTSVNAYYLALVTLVARTWVQLALAILCGGALWFVSRKPALRKLAMLFAAAFALTSLVQYTFGTAATSRWVSSQDNGITSLLIQSSRNVYFLSVESLHSPLALRQLYGLDAPAYAQYLRSAGFRVLDRSYSVDSSTRGSYERMLEFGLTEMNAARLADVLRADNSTFRSFRESGYQIQFIYVSRYFGVNPSSVTHLYPDRSYSICDHLPERYFFVACRSGFRRWLVDSVHVIPPPIGPDEQLAHLLSRITEVGRDRSRPWVTFAHLAYPFHTPADHRFDEPLRVQQFKAKYAASLPHVRDRYEVVVSAIRAHDPDAVIVTFGDHGAWLTRGMSAATGNRWYSAADYVEDRYGVFLAVSPAEFCREWIQDGNSTALLTRAVISCLNGQDAPSAGDRERSELVFDRGHLQPVDEISAR